MRLEIVKATCLIVPLLCASVGMLPGATPAPAIVTATINSTTSQITIVGANLVPSTGTPTVTLGTTPLTVVSATATKIVATLPASLAAGTDRLKVTAGTQSGYFDVSYGAQGPAGPAGPQGPQGPAGTLTLPYSGQATTGTYGLEVDQFGVGAIAIYGLSVENGVGVEGQGGTAVVSGSGGGAGVYGQGGGGVGVGNFGGPGGQFYGGGNLGEVIPAGPGVLAIGGDSAENGTAGDGIDALPGGGPTDNFSYGLAGWFDGTVTVAGNLNKSGGSFLIDHPTDPDHKYLYHSFVESPDMKNIYDGTVVTDGSGTANVKMPDWFEALNRDFRYQLTVIGQFAQGSWPRRSLTASS